MSDDRTPVLIGAGQFTPRDVDLAAAKEPVDMMAAAARQAAVDAGADARLLSHLDSVQVVNMICWQYRNPPRLLAERIGAHPAEALYSTVGGNTPQWLVNTTAARIAAGKVGLALIAGAEAFNTPRRARKAGVELNWTRDNAPPPATVGDPRMGSSDHEMAHSLQMPTQIYPLFENALRARRGLSIEAHRQRLGELYGRFSAVAAENPYAWFRTARTPAEIATLTAENRMIGFPYPKYMNAIMDVDQAAAILMTSVAGARRLGIDPSRWVYLRGAAHAHDLWFLSERMNYYMSPAIKLCGQTAMAMAGISIKQVDYFDLYSCFPCAVQIAADMLGIPANDPRPLTVTGGLAFAGGPGNNYTTHAIATVLEKVRARPGTIGLITGLGWYVTKHAVGIYSTTPNERPWAREAPRIHQEELDRMPHPELVPHASGRGLIEAYSVLHDRDGQPTVGVVIGRFEDGRRFLANTPDDRTLLENLMTHEGVGRRGVVSPVNGINRFAPD